MVASGDFIYFPEVPATSSSVFPGLYPSLQLSACPPLLKITASVLAAILSLARQDLPSRSNEQIHRAAVQRNVHPCCISFDSAHDKKDANHSMPDRGRVCRGFERQRGRSRCFQGAKTGNLRPAPTFSNVRRASTLPSACSLIQKEKQIVVTSGRSWRD